MDNSGISRRRFLQSAAMGMAALTIVPRHVLGAGFTAPSDQINLGMIGCGAQARWTLAPEFAKRANVIAACDVESRQLQEIQNIIEKITEEKTGKKMRGFKAYSDFRELLKNKDIDGVVIATPDHWHAIITIEAARAGKDVYVEKPMTHSIEEGRLMANAIDKYGRVLQTGNMQRSWRNFRHACELVQNGYIGDIKEIKVSVGGPPKAYDLQAEPVPSTLNWDMWVGPAVMNPYSSVLAPPMEKRVFPDWRLYKEYGGGMVCDWGAHMFDIAQWGMGMDNSGPVEFYPPDGKEFKVMTMKYANGTIMTHEDFGRGSGVRFIGSKGVIDISRDYLDTMPGKLATHELKDSEIRLYNSPDHYNDFLNSMKTRKQPMCTAEVGHRTASLCHIINICYEVNRPLKWNPEKEEFVGERAVNRMRSGFVREPWSLTV